MKILLTTPTGTLGARILGELLGPEFEVRVMTPHPERLPYAIREQVEVVSGSGDDPSMLRAALEGVESLFWCVPPPPNEGVNATDYYERFSRAVCSSIRAARTPRVVVVYERLTGTEELQRVEAILNESGAAIRHIHPVAPVASISVSLADNPAFPLAEPGRIVIAPDFSHDMVDSVLRWLVRRDWDEIEIVQVGAKGSITNSCDCVSESGASVIRSR
jgi:hypothetical protein